MTGAIYPDLTGKVVVVTGASSGIGAAIASALLSAGCRVLAVDRQPPTVEETEDFAFLTGDIAEEATSEDMVRVAAERWGGFTMLAHCAGILGVTRRSPTWTSMSSIASCA